MQCYVPAALGNRWWFVFLPKLYPLRDCPLGIRRICKSRRDAISVDCEMQKESLNAVGMQCYLPMALGNYLYCSFYRNYTYLFKILNF
jgi:hypothetical protein